MKLSTKGRYAVKAMIELSLNNQRGLLPLAELSLSNEISISYLEQLFARLRTNGLVTGVRGPRGGYRLARPAEEISVAEVLKAVDEKAEPVHPETSPHYDEKHKQTSALWLQLSRRIYDYLNRITLADVVSIPLDGAEEQKREFQYDSVLKNTSVA